MHHLRPFFKNCLGETPPYCERIKNSPFGFIWSSKLRWKFSHITYIKDRSFEGKIWGGDQQAIGKNGLRMHHLHPFFKHFLGETPTPPPLLQEDKKFPYGFIWSSTAKVKIRPRCVYRRSELWRQKLHTIFGEKINTNSAKNGLRMHHFSKIFPGEAPRTPTCRRGFPPPAPSPSINT